MYILLGLFFILIGFVMIFAPQVIYDITQNWKNYSSGDPSKWYIISTRVSGVLLVIVGILSIIFLR